LTCAVCGLEAWQLASVSDPFVDSCYSVCRDCLAPLWVKMAETRRREFAEAEALRAGERFRIA